MTSPVLGELSKRTVNLAAAEPVAHGAKDPHFLPSNFQLVRKE